MNEHNDLRSDLVRRSSFGIDAVRSMRDRMPATALHDALERAVKRMSLASAPGLAAVDGQRDLLPACAALGWSGYIVSNFAVLGRHVLAVVKVRTEVHEWRMANGWPPQSDPSWFRSWFEPSEHDRLPVAAVELVGVLITESRLDDALQACGTLMTVAPCAVAVPALSDDEPWPLVELDYYGIGVVRTTEHGDAELLVPPEDRSTEFGPSLFGRWLLEVLYERVLHGRGAMEMVSSEGVHG